MRSATQGPRDGILFVVAGLETWSRRLERLRSTLEPKEQAVLRARLDDVRRGPLGAAIEALRALAATGGGEGEMRRPGGRKVGCGEPGLDERHRPGRDLENDGASGLDRVRRSDGGSSAERPTGPRHIARLTLDEDSVL